MIQPTGCILQGSLQIFHLKVWHLLKDLFGPQAGSI